MPPFSWLYLVERYGLKILDYGKTPLSLTHRDIMVYGLPYIDNNIGLSDHLKKIELDKHKRIFFYYTLIILVLRIRMGEK